MERTHGRSWTNEPGLVKRARLFIAAVAVCSAALVGCRSSGPAGVVSIQSIEPSNESALLEGDRVIFEVKVRAQGFDKPGKVGVLVQSEGNLLGASELAPIESGKIATFRVPVAVPDVASIQIITPLYLGQAEKTSIVDVRNYKVMGRRG